MQVRIKSVKADRFPNTVGMPPVKRFSLKSKCVSVDMLPSSAGMLPENSFLDRSKYIRPSMPPNSGGMLPVSWFWGEASADTIMNFTVDMAASRGGNVPLKDAVKLFLCMLNFLTPFASRRPLPNPSQSVIFALFAQFRLPVLPSNVDLAARRMLQSLVSLALGVTPAGFQSVVELHTSLITWTLTFMVAVSLPLVAVSV